MSQFHYGSIQMSIRILTAYVKAKSQFHYGSIQIIMYTIIDGVLMTSQFHYGSIQVGYTSYELSIEG